MLNGHKLRSTFDFERVVVRVLELNKHWKVHGSNQGGSAGENSDLTWNFKILDLVAGQGTTVETILDIKSSGAFKGAKRKIKFPKEETGKPSSNCYRVHDVEELMTRLNLTQGNRNSKRSDVMVKISNSKAGWVGNKKSPKKLELKPQGEKIGQRRVTGWQGDSKNKSSKTSKGPVPKKKEKLHHKSMDRGQGSILDYINSTKGCSMTGEEESEQEFGVGRVNEV